MKYIPRCLKPPRMLIKLWGRIFSSVGRISDEEKVAIRIRLESYSNDVDENEDMIPSPIPTGPSTTITLIK